MEDNTNGRMLNSYTLSPFRLIEKRRMHLDTGIEHFQCRVLLPITHAPPSIEHTLLCAVNNCRTAR